MDQSWSWILTGIGAFSMLLVGQGLWVGWLFSLANQVAWTWYSLSTHQYGFLASVAIYTPIYLVNLRTALVRRDR